MTPFWATVAEWSSPVCDVAEIASGVPWVWAWRDEVGVPVAAVAPVALSVLAALMPVDVAVLSSTVSAVAIVSVPSSTLAVSLLVASACACCPAVARGCMASAMAAMGIVAPTMDVHAIAQSR